MGDDVFYRIAAARALLGTPFRLQGRDTAGMDCVGFIAAVHDLTEGAPCDYALRGTGADDAGALMDAHFRRRNGVVPHAGDVLLLDAGAAQLHLGLWTGSSLIHAHAGLRRVVETPGQLTYPLRGIWYLEAN